VDILNLKLDKKDYEELFKIIASIKDSINDIPKLKDKVDALEKKIAQLNKELVRLSSSDVFNNIANQPSDLHADQLREMRGRLEKSLGDIAKLLKEVEGLKELKQRVIILEDMMEQKLDREEFERWKAENDLQKIIQGLIKKFADRNEMIKALKRLEERIMALEEYMREHLANNITDNALFTTKPLGGWSCASCQKDIVNLEGMPAQFYPWAKFPQRNPTERIAKVGQGFSRMLSMVKPDVVANRSHYNNYNRAPEESTRFEKDSERQMVKTHNRGFSMGADLRPNTVHINDMPEVQQ
jgi:cell division septum initiation protein DivIVA